MWYIEITGFDTHAELADSLSNMGIKRIYVKVADGSVNTDIWPELIDESVVEATPRNRRSLHGFLQCSRTSPI